MTADDLFDLARAAIPDPRNPKPGDTYQRGRTMFGAGAVITVIDHDPKHASTRCYIAGELKGIKRFDLWLRSMPDARAVASETCPVDLPAGAA